MRDFSESRFWRMIALGFVLSLFYLGWAVSNRNASFLTSSAEAQVLYDRNTALSSGNYIVTSNPEGNTLYLYELEKTAQNEPLSLKRCNILRAPR